MAKTFREPSMNDGALGHPGSDQMDLKDAGERMRGVDSFGNDPEVVFDRKLGDLASVAAVEKRFRWGLFLLQDLGTRRNLCGDLVQVRLKLFLFEKK